MAKAYVLQEKMCTQTYADGFESLSAALGGLKKILRENCDIRPELAAISKEGLPAPKYRASVCKYLETFFYKDRFPSYTMIDYSDFEGEPVEFDGEWAGYYDFDWDIADFERKLGFSFSAGKQGICLKIIRGPIRTACYFLKSDENAFFGIEYWDGKRQALDARIVKSDRDLPPKLSGSFYPVLLLENLLHTDKKCSLMPSGSGKEDCLLEEMQDVLYDAMNEDCVLPSKLTFDKGTLQDYIKLLRDLGYTVKKLEDAYYIPPFICDKDSQLIWRCIADADIGEDAKRKLKSKFRKVVGCYRFSEDDMEESDLPVPHHDDWSAGSYGLIIYTMLRLCARPLMKCSEKKDSIQGMAKKYYGVEIDRKKSIPNNAAALVALDLSVKEENGKYCFDTKKLLLQEDMDTLVKCIAESDLAESEKQRLIEKLNDKFPVGKY